MNDGQDLQILRSIDKFDKIGRDGVIELLQKPEEEFGAGLDPVSAGLIGLFLDVSGSSNEETIDNLKAWYNHALKVRTRVGMMVILEESVEPNGTTKWDRLIAMRQNEDETWRDGGRPKNIAFALDDMIALFKASEDKE